MSDMTPEKFYKNLSEGMRYFTHPDDSNERVIGLLHLVREYLNETEVQDQEIVWCLGNLQDIARRKPIKAAV